MRRVLTEEDPAINTSGFGECDEGFLGFGGGVLVDIDHVAATTAAEEFENFGTNFDV